MMHTGELMSSKLLVAVASTALFLPALCVPAQQPAQLPAPRPIQSMPYSPSLDVSSLDRSADPCVDFYKFSCGGWQKKNPIPADQASWSVYAKLGNENQQFLWGILEDAAKAKVRTPVQQKIGDYFASCMDETSVDRAGLTPLKPGLTRIEEIKSRPALLNAIAEIHHTMQGSFFFASGTTQDAMDSNLMIVRVDAGGLGLPDRDYYTKTDAKSETIRQQYLSYIAQLLTMAGGQDVRSKADAASILRIETVLAKSSLTRVERRDPYKTYHKMTVAELEKLAPSIAWPEYFGTQGAQGVASLNVSQPKYMQTVNTELASEPLDDLKAYLRFHLLTAAAPSLAKAFEKAQFDFYSTTLRGV